MRSLCLTATMILFGFSAHAAEFGDLRCRDLAAWKGSSAFVVSWIHGVNERTEGEPIFTDLHDDFAFQKLNGEAAEVDKLCAAFPETHVYRIVDILYPELSGVDVAYIP